MNPDFRVESFKRKHYVVLLKLEITEVVASTLSNSFFKCFMGVNSPIASYAFVNGPYKCSSWEDIVKCGPIMKDGIV